jgi:short-subunit dehydrogenase
LWEPAVIDYHDITALVTGASSGIGKAFAETLARRGANVLLAARSADSLAALAETLRRDHGVRAHAIPVDLSTAEGPDRAFDAARKTGLPIDLLVNNAGFGMHGQLDRLPTDRLQSQVMLNVAALARLTRLALPDMLMRHKGFLINVASMAAFQPLPYMAIYGATKAFVLSFSLALWAEYRGRNIGVLAVCPGTTETDFFRVVGTEGAAVGRKRPAQGVVDGALRALERGRPLFIDGTVNFLRTIGIRLAPRRVAVQGAGAVMRPR